MRYFGGTKLGTGGLIDAYKTTSKLTIEAASIIEKPVMNHLKMNFNYEQMPQLMKLLKELEMEKLNATFENQCEIEFLLSMANTERLEQFIADNASIQLQKIAEL